MFNHKALTVVFAVAVTAAVFCSCRATPKVQIESVEYYISKLKDSDFVWNGPTSREYRIPKLHAARALAYIGDDAVPSLFDAIEDEAIDKYSIFDALGNIGLPVYDFRDDLLDYRDTTGIRRWWAEHQATSKARRSRHRIAIGLPELDP